MLKWHGVGEDESELEANFTSLHVPRVCMQSLNALRVLRLCGRSLRELRRSQTPTNPYLFCLISWSPLIGLHPFTRLFEMSDFEDDMDVDGPPPNHAIQFSSDNTTAKGKRIVADLPVEAEDNLPWYPLYQAWSVP